MPRSRGSEMPQRPSPRGPAQLRTSSSDSDARRHRPITDRSPKLHDRQSPRGAQTDSVNQKKLGVRIADLETQLGQAQEELKMLKEQLVSAEAAKKEAQEELEKKTKKPVVPQPAAIQEKLSRPTESNESDKDSNMPFEIHDDNQRATDVFEVPVDKVAVEPIVESNKLIDQEDYKMEPVNISTESPAVTEPEKPSIDELALKNDEVILLKAKLEEKEREVEAFYEENGSLKSQMNEAAQKISAAQIKDEEMTMRLAQLEKELEAGKGYRSQLIEKLKVVEGAKEALETEMKKLRVQTEQWRKAADAAAAVLAGGMDVISRRISERSGSIDKHFGSTFEQPAGPYAGFVAGPYAGFAGSPRLDDDADGILGTGKRKSSDMKMFGDLWKKKSQK